LNLIFNGAPDAILVETGSNNALTVEVKVLVRWKLPKIDPKELYRLRYSENIPSAELAKRFSRSRNTITSILGKYKREVLS